MTGEGVVDRIYGRSYSVLTSSPRIREDAVFQPAYMSHQRRYLDKHPALLLTEEVLEYQQSGSTMKVLEVFAYYDRREPSKPDEGTVIRFLEMSGCVCIHKRSGKIIHTLFHANIRHPTATSHVHYLAPHEPACYTRRKGDEAWNVLPGLDRTVCGTFLCALLLCLLHIPARRCSNVVAVSSPLYSVLNMCS